MKNNKTRVHGIMQGGMLFALASLMIGVLTAAQSRNFVPEETTIRGTHGAFVRGLVTRVQLTQAYLNPIQAYGDTGPARMPSSRSIPRR